MSHPNRYTEYITENMTFSGVVLSHLPNQIDNPFCFPQVSYRECVISFSTTILQSWEFAHLLISLKSNEGLWAIRSDRTRQMSDCERIAQVAPDKWATVSESLRSLMTNEQLWAICSGHSW